MSGFEEQYAVLSIVQQFQLREGWADKALAMEARPRQRQSGGPPTLQDSKRSLQLAPSEITKILPKS